MKIGVALMLAISVVHTQIYIQGPNIDDDYPWGFKSDSMFEPYGTKMDSINTVYTTIFVKVCSLQIERYSYFMPIANFDGCTKFIFCNQTLCIHYGPPVIAFGLLFTSTRGANVTAAPCLAREPEAFAEPEVITNCEKITARSGPTVHDYQPWSNDLNNKVTIGAVIRSGYGTALAEMQSYNTQLVERFYAAACSVNQQRTIYIEHNGPLAVGCSFVTIYTNTSKYVFNMPAQLLQDAWENRVSFCVPRLRLHTATSGTGNLQHLPFNLPGYRHCSHPSMNNTIPRATANNKIDMACAKFNSEATNNFSTAVDELLSEVWEQNRVLYQLFSYSLRTKLNYEKAHNSTYPAFRYFSIKKSRLEYSTQSTRNESGAQEFHWMELLNNIWVSACYDAIIETPYKTPADDQPEGTNEAPLTSQSTDSTPQQAPESSASSATLSDNTPSTVGSDVTLDTSNNIYPKAPAMFRQCRLVINEVATVNDENEIAYVEHKRICPPKGRQPKKDTANGYVEIVLETGEEIVQKVFANFYGKQTITVTETIGMKSTTNNYFTFGNGDVSFSMKFSESQATPDLSRGIPAATGKTFCIVLLHISGYHDTEGRHDMNLLKLRNVDGEYVPQALTMDRMDVIRKYLQDIFIIGDPCTPEQCGYCFDLLVEVSQVQEVNGVHLPAPDVSPIDGRRLYRSLSRCTSSPFPLQQDSFTEGNATPNRNNDCKKSKVRFPFDLTGSRLQSSAQKLIINAKTFFEGMTDDLTELENLPTAIQLAQVFGLSRTTIVKVISNWKKNEINTPGTKRPGFKKKVQDQFDTFRTDHVKRVIMGFYEANTPPLLNTVFEKFIREVREEENQLRVPVANRLRCSVYTFRKLLIKFGFKFSRINNRDVILMRSDIVTKRFEYLTAMRENRRSPTPRKVIYTDETWIDPFARTGKAWVMKGCTSYRERSLYSYQKNKVGRGPRVIILHAGGEMGFIPGAMLVYPVQKKKACLDYHDNVNAETYMRWWIEFLDSLPSDESFLIVIDNAPYHSRTDCPKSNDVKKVMYDWIYNNLPQDQKSTFKPIKDYLKPELWLMVKSMRASNKYYVVDREAEARGHKVVRLPPYNCDLNPIEYVWKDIKHAVRNQNTAQTAQSAGELAKKVMSEYTADQWQKHVDHVKKLEDKYWKDDNFYDVFIEENPRLIISIGPDDDSDDEDEEELVDPESFPSVMRSSVHDEEILQEVFETGDNDDDDNSVRRDNVVCQRRLFLPE